MCNLTYPSSNTIIMQINSRHVSFRQENFGGIIAVVGNIISSFSRFINVIFFDVIDKTFGEVNTPTQVVATTTPLKIAIRMLFWPRSTRAMV